MIQTQKTYPILLTIYITTLCATLAVYGRFIEVSQIPVLGFIIQLLKNIFMIPFSDYIPSGTLPFALTYPVCDIIAETYGPREAKKVMFLGFMSEALFAIIVCSAITIPARQMATDDPYILVFSSLYLFAFSNIVASFLGKCLNIYILSSLKVKYFGRHFYIRSIVSTTIGELALSIFAATVSFSSTLAFSQIIKVAFTAYAIKLLVAVILVKPVFHACIYIKKTDQMDVYDKKTSLNPFDFLSKSYTSQTLSN